MCEENENGVRSTEMTVIEKVKNIFRNITVEPLRFFHAVPVFFSNLAIQNLILEKACRVNLKYSDEVCTALISSQTEDFKVAEMNVQKLVASMSVWTNPLRSSIPALLIMFIGSWSYQNKIRKPFMLIPIFGELVSCVGLLVCVYYFYELPMGVAGFVNAFFPAITGGLITMYMAVFSYIGDRTSKEMRTVRFGILNLCNTVGIQVETALSGIALKKTGFYGIFSLSAMLYMINITYGVLRIKESTLKSLALKEYNSEKLKVSDTSLLDEKEKLSVLQILREIFDLNHIKATFLVVLKHSESNRRQSIILVIVAQMFVLAASEGQ